jgi:superfamily II DNA or RNA helicase
MSSAPPAQGRTTFPQELAFQRNWRTYQTRLLDRLDSYLDDNRLHIVAAPGSGKTTFGLEVVRRLNQPTLILAPTITIRNQWLERLVEQFLPPGSPNPEWATTDLHTPQLLTVATYQALHALCSGEPEQTDEAPAEDEPDPSASAPNGKETAERAARVEFPNSLSGFKTLVLDEAHHLRSEWWKTLTFVVEHLKPTLVALTATPPYDVSPFEWQRYEDLCGPVDAEIAVPELVLQGDLCPHQDYVYLSTPAPDESRTLTDFRSSVDSFVQQIKANQDFASAVEGHPWIKDPDTHLEEILDDPEYLSSMVAFLKSAGRQIPKAVLRALGADAKSIPDLNLEWLEILLTHCLYADAVNFQSIDPLLKLLRHDLIRIGAIERRRVVLRNPSDDARLLTTSRTKLHSIEEIVRLESASLQSSLRCAILTDYIRKSDLPKTPDAPAALEDMGAVPIFETLRRATIPNAKLGVLCGSLVIIPARARDLAKRTAEQQGLQLPDLVFNPMPHDPDYLTVQIAGENRQNAVRLITSVFEQGEINVLIGTKSLLGYF